MGLFFKIISLKGKGLLKQTGLKASPPAGPNTNAEQRDNNTLNLTRYQAGLLGLQTYLDAYSDFTLRNLNQDFRIGHEVSDHQKKYFPEESPLHITMEPPTLKRAAESILNFTEFSETESAPDLIQAFLTADFLISKPLMDVIEAAIYHNFKTNPLTFLIACETFYPTENQNKTNSQIMVPQLLVPVIQKLIDAYVERLLSEIWRDDSSVREKLTKTLQFFSQLHPLLKENMGTLKLEEKNITSEHMDLLNQILSYTPGLKELNLAQNKISDAGVRNLNLDHQGNLQILDLNKNNIGSHGARNLPLVQRLINT